MASVALSAEAVAYCESINQFVVLRPHFRVSEK